MATKQVIDKATELIKTFSQFTYEQYEAIGNAQSCIEEIKKAIKTTTGHCQLRALDLQEVNHDLKFWDEVSDEISKHNE